MNKALQVSCQFQQSLHCSILAAVLEPTITPFACQALVEFARV
jgi:hypothetical protein